jgi:hypothetical protein
LRPSWSLETKADHRNSRPMGLTAATAPAKGLIHGHGETARDTEACLSGLTLLTVYQHARGGKRKARIGVPPLGGETDPSFWL